MLLSAFALLLSAQGLTAHTVIEDPWKGEKGCQVARHGIEFSDRAVRSNLANSVANFEIIRPWEAGVSLDPILSSLRMKGFSAYYAAEDNAMGKQWYVFAEDTIVHNGKSSFLERLTSLCDLVESFDFTVLRGRVVTVSERQAEKIQRRRGEEQIPELPNNSDLSRYLARYWEQHSYYFFERKEVRFSRVRDSQCHARWDGETRYYVCTVGALGTSADGPEYGQAEVEVEWGPDIFRSRDLVEHPNYIIPHQRSKQ